MKCEFFLNSEGLSYLPFARQILAIQVLKIWQNFQNYRSVNKNCVIITIVSAMVHKHGEIDSNIMPFSLTVAQHRNFHTTAMSMQTVSS